MNVSEALWKSRLSALVGQLARNGDLRSASWRVAFTETPRHITSFEPGGQHPVIQAGPRRLWDSVETAYHLWCHLDRPDPGRFGVVANPTTQFVWFDTDEGWYRWPLPLA